MNADGTKLDFRRLLGRTRRQSSFARSEVHITYCTFYLRHCSMIRFSVAVLGLGVQLLGVSTFSSAAGPPLSSEAIDCQTTTTKKHNGSYSANFLCLCYKTQPLINQPGFYKLARELSIEGTISVQQSGEQVMKLRLPAPQITKTSIGTVYRVTSFPCFSVRARGRGTFLSFFFFPFLLGLRRIFENLCPLQARSLENSRRAWRRRLCRR